MNLLIDINHPAHVHYSKYMYKELISNGHSVVVTARDRDPTFDLLRSEGIEFYNRGTGSNSVFGKAFYFLKGNYEIYKVAKKHRPDIFLCFMSPYAPQVSKLLGKPSIIIDDTEHAKLHDRFTYPFCDVILTPESFYRDLGPKQLRFSSYLELNYLHPNRYKPDKGIFNLLGIDPSDRYIVIRLVGWGGHHDVGHKGISKEVQKQLIETLSRNFKVIISSEIPLPDIYEPYRAEIPPDRIHDVLAFASLFIGESGTMASESVVLGTPAVYVNSLPLMGYLAAAQKNGMLFHYSDDHDVINKVKELVEIPDLKKHFSEKYRSHIKNAIDGSSFLAWFVENYPDSFDQMKANPELQFQFDRIQY